MAWTEERVADLKRLWAEGHSASQIAKQLGGVTRNAVIGKVHRLGLSGRATPSRPVKRPPRLARPKPQVIRKNGTTTVVKPAPLPSVALPEEKAAQLEPQKLPNGDFVTVVNVKDTMCKWPIGDPADPAFSFCGRKAADGSPYCAHHAKMAFQPARKRDRRASEENQIRRLAS